MVPKVDLAGKKFGLLTVLYETGRAPSGDVLWNCNCDCGRTTRVTRNHLTSGHTKSCGDHPFYTHGKSSAPIYKSWQMMIQRCCNPNYDSFLYYGGRGIAVCKQWRNSFEVFEADMGPRPSLKYSLDRYPDKNGNYKPGNCRWATKKQQQRNKRDTQMVTINGVTKLVVEWAEESGLSLSTLDGRIRRGWPESRLLEEQHPRGGQTKAIRDRLRLS